MSNSTNVGQIYLEMNMGLEKFYARIKEAERALASMIEKVENTQVSMQIDDPKLQESLGKLKSFLTVSNEIFAKATKVIETYQQKSGSAAESTKKVIQVFDQYHKSLNSTLKGLSSVKEKVATHYSEVEAVMKGNVKDRASMTLLPSMPTPLLRQGADEEKIALIGLETRLKAYIKLITQGTQEEKSAFQQRKTGLETSIRVLTNLIGTYENLQAVISSVGGAKFDRLISVPGISDVITPIKQMSEYLSGTLSRSIAGIDELLTATFNNPHALTAESLDYFNQQLLKTYSLSARVEGIMGAINSIVQKSNAILTASGDSWSRIGKEANAVRFTKITKELQDANTKMQELSTVGLGSDQSFSILGQLEKSLHTAQTRLSKTFGTPINQSFEQAIFYSESLKKTLDSLQVTRGKKDVSELTSNLKATLKNIEAIERQATDLNLRELAGGSETAANAIKEVRNSLEDATRATTVVKEKIMSLGEAMKQTAEIFGKPFVKAAMDQNTKSIEATYMALSNLDKIRGQSDLKAKILKTTDLDKKSFARTTLEYEGLDQSLLKVASSFTKLAKTGRETVFDVLGPGSSGKVADLVNQLKILGYSFGDTFKLGTTYAMDFASQLRWMQADIVNTINTSKEYQELVSSFGATGARLLIKKSDTDTARKGLLDLQNKFTDFLNSMDAHVTVKGHTITTKLRDIFAKSAQEANPRAISSEKIAQDISKSVLDFASPLKEAENTVIRIQRAFVQLVKESSGKNTFAAKAEEVKVFQDSLINLQNAINMLYKTLTQAEGDELQQLLVFKDSGVAEKAILDIYNLTESIGKLFTTKEGLKDFEAAWQSGAIIHMINGVAQGIQELSGVTKTKTKDMTADVEEFVSIIRSVLGTLKTEWEEMAALQQVTKFSFGQFEEFYKTSALIDGNTQKIKENVEMWERYNQELLNLKTQPVEQFISNMGNKAHTTALQVEEFASKLASVEELQSKFVAAGGRGVAGKTAPMELYQVRYAALLKDRIKATKETVDREYESYHRNAIKLQQLDKGTAEQREEYLRKQLARLIDEQNKYGVSVKNMTDQLRVWENIQREVGTLTAEETKGIEKLKTSIAQLGITFKTSAELQTQLSKGSAAPEAMGLAYTAATNRLSTYKNTLESLINTTAQYLGTKAEVTEVEKKYVQQQTKVEQKLNNQIQLYNTLTEVEQLVGKRTSVVKEDPNTQKTTEDYNILEQAVNGVNKQLEILKSSTRIKLDPGNLKDLITQLNTIKSRLSSSMQKTVDGLTEKFGSFKIDFTVESHNAKANQELKQSTEQLKTLGQIEQQDIRNKEIRIQRIQALQNAYKHLAFPQEQLKVFLQDEIAIQEKRLQQMKTENTLRGGGIVSALEEKQAQVELNDTKLLYNDVLNASEQGTRSYLKAQKEASEYSEKLNNQAKEATGRYRGVQKALQSIFSDIRNLIQIQIRWYTTQALIFKSLEAFKGLFTFYETVETQVAKVTTALLAQADATKTAGEVHKVLTSEMIRTGKSAEDLATIMWELVSAGLSHKEAMAGVSHITNLAVGSELDLNETVRITAGLFRIFGDELDVVGGATAKWKYIVDSLSATLNISQVDMNGLIAGLGYLVNETDAAGIKFEEMLGILSVLNNRLLLGSKAGRSASRVITQLTSNAKELVKTFGLEIDYTKPLDMLDVLTKLNKVLKDNTVNGEVTVETFDKLQSIFGQVGKRAAIGLITNLEELEHTIHRLRSGEFEGLTERMAEVKLEPLAVQVSKFTAALKTLSVAAIEPFAISLQKILSLFNELVQMMVNLPSFIKQIGSLGLGFVGVLTGVHALVLGLRALKIGAAVGTFDAIGRLTVRLIGLSSASKVAGTALSLNLVGRLKNYITAAKAAATATTTWGIAQASHIGGMAALGGVVTIVIAAIVGLIVILNKYSHRLENTTAKLKELRDTYADTIQNIEVETNTFSSLIDKYKEATPYTNEWLNIRNQLLSKYPGFLHQLEAELMLTGKTTNTIKDFVAEKERQARVEAQLNDIHAAAEKQSKLTEDRLEGLTNRVQRYKLSIAEMGEKTQEAFRLASVGAQYVGQGAGGAGIGLAALGLGTRIPTKKSIQAELKSSEKVIFDYLDTYKNVFGKQLPEAILPFALSIMSIKSPLETIFTLTESLNKVKGKGMEVTTAFEQAFNSLDESIKKNLNTKVQVKVGTTLNKDQVTQLYKDLHAVVTKVAGDDIGQTSVIKQFHILVKQIGLTSKQEFNKAKVSLEDYQETMDEFVTNFVTSNFPLAVQDMLKNNGLALNDIVREAIKNNEVLIMKSTPSTLKSALDNIIEEVEDKFDKLANVTLKAGFLGASNSIIEQLANLNIEAPELIEETKKKIQAELNALGAEGRRVFRDQLGTEGVEALDRLMTTTGLARYNLQVLRDTFIDVRNAAEIASPALKNAFADALDPVKQMNNATSQLIVAMGQLVGETRPAMTRYLETNKYIINEALRYLPVEAQKILSTTTTLEQAELLKMVKETKTKIREELSGLGGQVSPGMSESIALKHYTEMYNNIKSSAKDAFDTQRQLREQWRSETVAALEGIHTEESSLVIAQSEYAEEKIKILRDFEEKRKKLEQAYKAEEILTFPPKILQDYTAATTTTETLQRSFEELTDKINMNNDALISVTKGYDLLKEKFTTMGQAKILVEHNLFKDHKDELERFVTARPQEVETTFKNIFNSLSSSQQVFFNESIEIIKAYQGLNSQQALQWMQNLVSAALGGDKATLDEAIKVLVENIKQDIATTERVRSSVSNDIVNAQVDAAAAYQAGMVRASKTSDALQNVKDELKKASLQMQLQLNADEYAAQKNHYKRLETIRETELKDLQSYMSTYQHLLDPTSIQQLLEKDLQINAKIFEEKRKQRETDIKFTSSMYNINKQLAEIELARSERYASTLSQQTLEQINKIDQQLKELEERRENATAQALAKVTTTTPLMGKGWHLFGFGEEDTTIEQRVATEKEKIIDALNITKADLLNKRMEIVNEERKANETLITRQKLSNEKMHEEFSSSVNTFTKDLAKLTQQEIEMLTNHVSTGFKTLREEMTQELSQIFGSLNTVQLNLNLNELGGLEVWKEETKTRLTNYANEITNRFYNVLGEGLSYGMTNTQINEAAINFENQLTAMYTESFTHLENSADEEREKAQEKLQLLTKATMAINPQELNQAVLQNLKIDIQDVYNLESKLVTSYKEQKEEIRQVIQANLERIRTSKEAYEIALRSQQNEIANYNKLIAVVQKESPKASKDIIQQYVTAKVALERAHSKLSSAETDEEREKQTKVTNAIADRIKSMETEYHLTGMTKDEVHEIYDAYVSIKRADADILIKMRRVNEATEEFKDNLDEAAERIRRIGSPFEKFVLGMRESAQELMQTALDLEQIGKDVISGLSSALQEGFSNTIKELALAFSGAATEEEVGLQENIMEKQKEINEIQQKIADLELGGVDYGEVSELENLQKQLKEAQKEAAKFNQELRVAGDHSKRLAEIWKQVGQAIVDQLIQIATQMMVNVAIGLIFKAISSIGGTSSPGEGFTGNFSEFSKNFRFNLNTRAKGGVLEGGFSNLTNNKETFNMVEKLFGAKLFSSGGIANGPVLGVVGEGSRSEAVVPLPDNRSIPVTFTGDKQDSGVKIMNIVDPMMVPSVLLENPETVINIIGQDIQKRGPTYHAFKTIATEKR